MKNRLVISLSFLFLVSCVNDEKKVLVYYYSKKAPKSTHPEEYIIQRSYITGTKRCDSLYYFEFDGLTYNLSHTTFVNYIFKKDSIFLYDSPKYKGSVITNFTQNKCDTIIRDGEFSEEELNCYIGRKAIEVNGEKFNSYCIKTKVLGPDGSILKESYFDENMNLLRQVGNVVLGFGPYTIERVKQVPASIKSF